MGVLKTVLKRAWRKIVPGVKAAGKRALPHAAGILTSKGDYSHKKRAAVGLAQKFGKDVVRSVVH